MKKLLIILISIITLSTNLSNISLANDVDKDEGFFNGFWMKEDGFAILLTQENKIHPKVHPATKNKNYVEIKGIDVNAIYGKDDGFEYEISGYTWSPGNAVITVNRKSKKNGCIGELYMSFNKISDSSFRQTTMGTNGKCGLKKNLNESFVYEYIDLSEDDE